MANTIDSKLLGVPLHNVSSTRAHSDGYLSLVVPIRMIGLICLWLSLCRSGPVIHSPHHRKIQQAFLGRVTLSDRFDT